MKIKEIIESTTRNRQPDGSILLSATFVAHLNIPFERTLDTHQVALSVADFARQTRRSLINDELTAILEFQSSLYRESSKEGDPERRRFLMEMCSRFDNLLNELDPR